jgi:predicted secreted protein
MTTSLLVISACAGSANQVSVELSCDDFINNPHNKKEVVISTGETLEVILCENRTTGFQWSETAKITDTNILEQTSYKFAAPGSKLYGAPGEGTWNFHALQKGTVKVSMEYSQDWAGGLKSAWTTELTITVK